MNKNNNNTQLRWNDRKKQKLSNYREILDPSQISPRVQLELITNPSTKLERISSSSFRDITWKFGRLSEKIGVPSGIPRITETQCRFNRVNIIFRILHEISFNLMCILYSTDYWVTYKGSQFVIQYMHHVRKTRIFSAFAYSIRVITNWRIDIILNGFSFEAFLHVHLYFHELFNITLSYSYLRASTN